jgi:hypothetical protein
MMPIHPTENLCVALSAKIFSKDQHRQHAALRSVTTFYEGGKPDLVSLAKALPELPETESEVRSIAKVLNVDNSDLKFGADDAIVVPDDKKKPVMAFIDISRRNKVEGIVLDERRSGKWNTSFWDPKLDETFPLRGMHPDGELLPTTRESRCRPPSKPLKDFKCS